MIPTYIEILISLLTGILFASVLMPLILRVANRRNMFDTISVRKIHHGDIPRLGGVSFVPALAMALLSLTGINILFGNHDVTFIFGHNVRLITFTSLALATMFCLGLADDIFGVRYLNKFLIQILCGGLLIAGGCQITSLYGVLGIEELSTPVSWFVTILMTVFVINSMNLIDGIDGLATLIFQYTMFAYMTMFLWSDDIVGALMAVCCIGVTLPFLRYNLFGSCKKNNKIFMGDTGSMTLGLIIMILGLRLLGSIEKYHLCNPVVAVLSPIIVPCFDTVRVYILRVLKHRSPFLPDLNHVHHRLLDTGLSQHYVLISIVFWAILMYNINILLSVITDVNVILCFDLIIWILSLYVVKRYRSRTDKN